METKFKCLHSGKCCEKIYTQISLTVGDLVRLSQHQKMGVEELFKRGFVGLKPFFIDENLFEAELGLTIPCKFRRKRRCVAYEARPLNCRLFPYWLITEVPEEKIGEYVDESYECVHRIQLSGNTKAKYTGYKQKIVKILEREAGITETILKNHDFMRKIDITSHEGYQQLQEKIDKSRQSYSGIELEKHIDELKIEFAICIVDNMINVDVGEIFNEEISKHNLKKQVSTLEDINRIEKIKG